MQPCSREMQGLNSIFNNNSSSSNHTQQQIQMNQLNLDQLDPTATSNDDFLKHMLSSSSSSPSSFWPGPDPETAPSNALDDSNNVAAAFPYDDHAALASKFRSHQISPNAKAAAAALMLQQQLLMSRGLPAADSALLQMPPLSLAGGIDFDSSRNDVVDASSFKSPNPGGEASVQALFNGFNGSLNGAAAAFASNHTHQFQPPQGPGQSFGGGTQGGGGGGGGNTTAQPKQRVRARRGQATDPHSIAERLRRERIAERMKALQELVPNANKTDKASMLDEIIDYVKFLQLQVKVLSMSRLGGAAAVAPLVADITTEGGGDCGQPNSANGNKTAPSSSSDTLTMTEHQVAKLMEEDMGSAMQYLQGKGLCLMPISLATAISTATCHARNPLISNQVIASNGEGPSSPGMSALTVQSGTLGNGDVVKDATSVSKP